MITIHLENRGSQWCSPANRMPEKPSPELVAVRRQMCADCLRAAHAGPRLSAASHFTILADGSVIDHGRIDYAAQHNKRVRFMQPPVEAP